MQKNSIYRVKAGDNVLSVSETVKVPPYKIIADNNLTADLYAGQLLLIKRLDRVIYRVKPFDTIDSICKKFSITEEEFTSFNGSKIVHFNIFVYV